MKDQHNSGRPLTQEEMHWDRIGMFLMAMSVGMFIGALLLTGRDQPILPEAAGLMLAAIGMAATILIAGRTIFVNRSASKAQTLQRKTRRARWTMAGLGLTFVDAIGAVSGNIMAG